MKLTLKTAPTKAPVTIEEIKAMLGLETDQDQFDGLLQSLLTAAVNMFEEETNTRLMEQSWYQYFSDWPLEDDFMEIAYPPLVSIATIKYTTSAEAEVEWASSNYVVDIATKPGRVYLGYLDGFPTATLTPRADAIEVDFTCGYENENNVPYDIKNALKLLVEWWFTNRAEGNSKIPSYITAAIHKHKIYYL